MEPDRAWLTKQVTSKDTRPALWVSPWDTREKERVGKVSRKPEEAAMTLERGGLRATHTQPAHWVSGGCLLGPAVPSTSEALQS